ncbi:MAG TPA: DMT family transporter [Burkholderiales bacterium]|nr:DMT family transporter [Burkholderiales bacterium]
MNDNKLLPVGALLFSATAWGVIWYPYRLLEKAGVVGEMATFVTYLTALVLISLLFPMAWRQFGRAPGALAVIALSGGWCNLAYVLGTLSGEVMRVLLLFYLAPLWTVPLARFILKEKISFSGYAVVFLALCGAMVMLWNPSLGLPIPTSGAEWLGLSSGFAFSLANVMVRRVHNCGVAVKTQSIFLGTTVVALVVALSRSGNTPEMLNLMRDEWGMVLFTAAVLASMSLAVNYALSHMAATRAIIIMLFELVVAAVASYFLVGEEMDLKEWVGGAMIVAASVFSGIMEGRQSPEQAPAVA